MEMGSSSATDSGASGSNDSLNGLKFGKKIYFDDGGVGGLGGGSSKASASLPASALPAPLKKGKRVAEQPPRCQVEGCKADLTGAKAYYCRHKVCGTHSKDPKVIVAGLEQRFCQQCSRFHQLPEFDQGKRSCRRRLAGHNKRRRKPPPGCLSSRISYQENNSRFRGYLMDFSSHPRLPGASQDTWPMARTGNRAPCQQWQGGLGAHPPCRVTQGAMNPCMQTSASEALFSAPDIPSRECRPAGASDPSCALSLLSAHPWGGIAMRSQALPASTSSSFNVAPMAQPAVTSNCMADPWGFKAHGSSSSSHEVQHSIGSGHAAQTDSGCFAAGELELALQGNRQCVNLDSDDVIHWSL